jgi:hypothetical protein
MVPSAPTEPSVTRGSSTSLVEQQSNGLPLMCRSQNGCQPAGNVSVR